MGKKQKHEVSEAGKAAGIVSIESEEIDTEFLGEVPPEVEFHEVPEVQIGTLEIPVVVDLGNGYISRRLDFMMSQEQGENALRIAKGLHAQGTQLKSGRFVHTPQDAVRWLLEQFVVAEEEEPAQSPVN